MINSPAEYTLFSTNMGWMGLVSTDRGIFASVLPFQDKNTAMATLLSRVPVTPQYAPGAFRQEQKILQAYFEGRSVDYHWDIDWSWATPFQQKVLQVVQGIPAGKILSYGEVAGLIGQPGAARAVGGALGANNIPLIIPCHRVIGKNGGLVGFTGAPMALKARLLKLEGVKFDK